MLKKIKKFYLYVKACHKGEILKRIEYKIKDLIGFFYIRTEFQKKNISCEITNTSINIDNINLEINTDEETYRVFNNKFLYKDITKYFSNNKVFWRKQRLNEYEDIKNIWEYNRLQILPAITIKYLKTKKKEYIDEVVRILDYWKENNEFDYTINWNNNLEIAIRAINIVLTLILIQDEKMNKKYASLLYLHAKHIYSEIEYSNICIPNNHVIGEALALLILSNILIVKENKKWQKKSIEILNKYIDIIDDDGVSKENSFSYQFFVTKMYILSLCFIKDKETFKKINEKIIKSLDVLKYTIIDKQRILNYGDNDGGFLYSIYMDYSISKDIEEYYNLFFKNEINNETSIYLEIFKKFNPTNKIITSKEKQQNYLVTKKIFIYKWNNNILFFNAKKIEGHAHNDSLAINLIIDGKEVIADSGTFSYNISQEKRKYYRSRRAHSTIQIEEDRNCHKIGTFRWIDKNNANLKLLENSDNILKIKGKIEHFCERIITIYKKKNKIEIQDINLKGKTIKSHWITLDGKIRTKNNIDLDIIKIKYNKNVNIKEQNVDISKKYLQEQKAKLYIIESNKNQMRLKLEW